MELLNLIGISALVFAVYAGCAWAEDEAPNVPATDRPVAYDYVFKYGLYRLLSSTDDTTCRAILDMLNVRFKRPGPQALYDH